MFSRLLTVALLTAGTALAFSTAQAQTSGSSGTGSSSGSSTMTPSTPSTGSGGSTMGSGSSSTQQAQQPMSGGAFSAKNYKTKTECLNAATAAHADRTLCDSLK
jgi:hypothetical protein